LISWEEQQRRVMWEELIHTGYLEHEISSFDKFIQGAKELCTPSYCHDCPYYNNCLGRFCADKQENK